MLRSAFLLALMLISFCVPAIAQERKTRDQMVREDREKVTTEGFWIYNDLAHAFDVAKESGKPLLVVLRCIPCEECVKLDDERGKDGIPIEGMALRVKHVRQYGPHAAAKNAGFQKDDVVVKYDSRSDLITDSAVLRYGVTQHAVGHKISVDVVRGGKSIMLQLPMQP